MDFQYVFCFNHCSKYLTYDALVELFLKMFSMLCFSGKSLPQGLLRVFVSSVMVCFYFLLGILTVVKAVLTHVFNAYIGIILFRFKLLG